LIGKKYKSKKEEIKRKPAEFIEEFGRLYY
jgi:hypothetical protein